MALRATGWSESIVLISTPPTSFSAACGVRCFKRACATALPAGRRRPVSKVCESSHRSRLRAADLQNRSALRLLVPALAPFPYEPKAEGGSCCYRTQSASRRLLKL